MENGARTAELNPLTDKVTCMCVDESGRLFLSDAYGRISVWNMKSIASGKNKVPEPLISHKFNASAFDGLLIVNDENQMVVYCVADQTKKVLPPVKWSFAEFSHDQNHIYLCNCEGMIMAWRRSDYKLIFQGNADGTNIWAITADGKGNLYDFRSGENKYDEHGNVVGGVGTGPIRVWNTQDNFKHSVYMRIGIGIVIKSMKYFHGHLVILTNGDLEVWSVKEKRRVQEIRDADIIKILIFGDVLIGTNKQGDVYFWKKGEPCLTQSKQLKIPGDIHDFAANSRNIVSFCENRLIVYDVDNGNFVCEMFLDAPVDACFFECNKAIAISAGKVMWFEIVP